MSEEKRSSRTANSTYVAMQLQKSIAKVATLPKGVCKAADAKTERR